MQVLVLFQCAEMRRLLFELPEISVPTQSTFHICITTFVLDFRSEVSRTFRTEVSGHFTPVSNGHFWTHGNKLRHFGPKMLGLKCPVTGDNFGPDTLFTFSDIEARWQKCYLVYLAICPASDNFNQSECASRILFRVNGIWYRFNYQFIVS